MIAYYQSPQVVSTWQDSTCGTGEIFVDMSDGSRQKRNVWEMPPPPVDVEPIAPIVHARPLNRHERRAARKRANRR